MNGGRKLSAVPIRLDPSGLIERVRNNDRDDKVRRSGGLRTRPQENISGQPSDFTKYRPYQFDLSAILALL